jgi:hypothetical protein
MSSPYLQAILSAYAELDIEKLRFHLKDEYSYEDTSKDIFLEKMEKIFKQHKHLEDTELLMFRGKCGSDECENCGKGGYRFVGNHSKNYLDLLFMEEEGDVISLRRVTFPQVRDSAKPDADCPSLASMIL